MYWLLTNLLNIPSHIFNNGLVIQWGYVTGNAMKEYTSNLPITANACYGIAGCLTGGSGWPNVRFIFRFNNNKISYNLNSTGTFNVTGAWIAITS